ncbi:PspC-related protein choline-binding protein 1 [Streptococcus pseudopneumoniae]|uniref:PspC-related protein choline-binding protein 1 n=1 Tax=Streptococcus pseudopneumoniae TaxID=257758 RepID=UPI0018B0624D|nr:PspC-related protein choline-binding protein 1 [Streptococcus pseudopneumoniae]MBF9678078.1 PspC-related protein choline-binding protein 1 [Streptococcus pseudopneumoniae]
MELNTKKEVTPGKLGAKAFKNKVFYKYETGEKTILKTTPEKVIITEPTTQVIKVGTKPTVVTEKIESSIKYIKDPNRPIGSDVVTESDGEDGIKKITTTYSLNENTGEVTVKENTTTIEKKAQDIVYKVGAQDKIQETTINHKKIYENDDNLEVRTRKVKTPGENGKIVTTTSYSVSPINGTPTPNTPIEKRTEPKTEVITIGTKPTVRVKDFYSEEVKFVKDLEHQKGSNPETIPGEKGTKEITTTYKLDTNTGEVSELETTEKILTQPTPTVVKVPAKDKIEHKDIPIEAEYEADPTLEKGKKVDDPNRQGKLGIRTITTTYRIENGKAVEDTSTEKVTTPMEKKIIKVGTKPTVRVGDIESKEVKFEKDLEHPRGSNPETIPGENGTKEITTTYKLDTNTGEVSELETTEKILTQPTPTVVKVPAKDKVEKRIAEKSTNIRFEKDETRDRNENPVTIDGEDGYVTTTTTYDVNPETGKVSEKITVDRKEATDTVIKVPAKSKVDREVLPTSVIRYEKDESRDRGASIEMVDGEDGYVTTTRTYDVNPETGKVSEKVTVDRKEATDTVIKVPAKSKVEEVLVPFATKYEADNDLSAGQEQEITLGKNGKTVTTITYDVDGKSGQVTESTLSQKEDSQTRVVKKGTKPQVLVQEIPIETEYLDDSTLDKGQEIEEAGEIGEITLTTIYTVDERDGTIEETTSRQITKEMVKRRIRRGTREPEKVVVPKKSSIPSYPVSVTSNQGTDSALEPAKPVAATTGWKQENGMWYFYNTNGSMVTGWVQVNGSWYYLNSNGSMATGWEQVDGSWYYLNDNGSMEIGWLQNNGSWYYLNSNGSMKANQWFQVGSKWYYVNASGELAINTSIDGYRVNDNGEWVR